MGLSWLGRAFHWLTSGAFTRDANGSFKPGPEVKALDEQIDADSMTKFLGKGNDNRLPTDQAMKQQSVARGYDAAGDGTARQIWNQKVIPTAVEGAHQQVSEVAAAFMAFGLGAAVTIVQEFAGSAGAAAARGMGNVSGGETTAETALENAERWLGPNYREIAPGVFRSADGLRQFRMTTSDLTHGTPHVHFESIGCNGKTITENSHVDISNP
jgi:hypothetical protein